MRAACQDVECARFGGGWLQASDARDFETHVSKATHNSELLRSMAFPLLLFSIFRNYFCYQLLHGPPAPINKICRGLPPIPLLLLSILLLLPRTEVGSVVSDVALDRLSPIPVLLQPAKDLPGMAGTTRTARPGDISEVLAILIFRLP